MWLRLLVALPLDRSNVLQYQYDCRNFRCLSPIDFDFSPSLRNETRNSGERSKIRQ